jgi:pentatricopeptide repeat protein
MEELSNQTFMVRVCEQAQNWDDMFEFVKEMIKAKRGQDFTLEERNLLSNAFKSSIEADR